MPSDFQTMDVVVYKALNRSNTFIKLQWWGNVSLASDESKHMYCEQNCFAISLFWLWNNIHMMMCMHDEIKEKGKKLPMHMFSVSTYFVLILWSKNKGLAWCNVETPYYDNDLILTPIISSLSGWQWTWSCLELHMCGFRDGGWQFLTFERCH